MRYLVVFEKEGGYESIRKKDIVASYNTQYWGVKKAQQWAKDACAQTKGTVVLYQTKNSYIVVD